MIRRQVRSPVGAMPAFPPATLTEEEIEHIIEFIEGLEGEHAHAIPEDVAAEVELHHWMAILALEVDDVGEAVRHAGHIIKLVSGDHRDRMEEVLDVLERGGLHGAAHAIQGMLTGAASPKVAPAVMRLRMALSSIEGDDADSVVHRLEHYRDLVEGPSPLAADEAISLVRAGDLHDADHEIETLMEGAHEEEEPHQGGTDEE